MFDEGKGTVAEDLLGNELDGTLKGDPKWVDGKFGKALELDGSGAFVEVPGHENPREEITVSIWVKSKTDTWNQHGFFVEKRNAYVLHPNANTKVVAWATCTTAAGTNPTHGALTLLDLTTLLIGTCTLSHITAIQANGLSILMPRKKVLWI